MSTVENEFTSLLRAVAEERLRGLNGHPTPEELLAYHSGNLGSEGKARIRSHLALCSECTRTVLDLQAFPDVDPSGDESRLSDDDVARAWRSFRSAAARLLPWNRRLLRFPEIAVAAALLLVSLGLGFRLYQLTQPRTDVYVADLTASDVRRSGGAATTLRPPPAARRLVFVLEVPEFSSSPDYLLRLYALEDQREEVVWSQGGVMPSAEARLVVDLPRYLVPEHFRIDVLERAESGPELVATYPGRLPDSAR